MSLIEWRVVQISDVVLRVIIIIYTIGTLFGTLGIFFVDLILEYRIFSTVPVLEFVLSIRIQCK